MPRADGRGGRPLGMKKTGGRQKGTRNYPTEEARVIAARAARRGESPVEYMLSVMRDPHADQARRDQMAIAVANYVHPKFAVTESKIEQTMAIVSKDELAARADKEIAEAFREWKSPVIEHQAAQEPVKPEDPGKAETVVSRLLWRHGPKPGFLL